MTELLGLHPDLLDLDDLSALSLRLVLDLLFTSIVVLLVYVRRYGKNEYVFTYFMFNLVTFTLCFLLRKVPIELGFALGLFAVFGILRYRTEPIRTQDLTYLSSRIAAGTYAWVPAEVRTVATPCVLIAHVDAHAGVVRAVLKAMFDRQASLTKTHPKWAQVNVATSHKLRETGDQPFHPGAEAYLDGLKATP